ncbi:hypothetical protein ASPACDRAFT_79979 [Aspergillus aculeatus ATCC 16872]|uniref:Uncharacterized protein n=1 Tax=Aspergillus aculeatus (strain ATCC 16872 / CBS 172.66 / WB 5094) TaxID=690307 RepID=A0A1L9WNV5_ASPA1|nr:uncharacterized protein ASPACDRAFT_79979 [Aspergillus aculeatus ATCC 16872]OJJ97848.1 hypothetical protein ASPACDRAFT_79979 [Aspergillus aculeatus ATCC 16872]
MSASDNTTIYQRSHALNSTSLWYAALSDLFPTAAGFTVDLEAGIISPMRESYTRITVTLREPGHDDAAEAEVGAKNVAGRDGSRSRSGSGTLIIFTLISGSRTRATTCSFCGISWPPCTQSWPRPLLPTPPSLASATAFIGRAHRRRRDASSSAGDDAVLSVGFGPRRVGVACGAGVR